MTLLRNIVTVSFVALAVFQPASVNADNCTEHDFNKVQKVLDKLINSEVCGDLFKVDPKKYFKKYFKKNTKEDSKKDSDKDSKKDSDSDSDKDVDQDVDQDPEDIFKYCLMPDCVMNLYDTADKLPGCVTTEKNDLKSFANACGEKK